MFASFSTQMRFDLVCLEGYEKNFEKNMFFWVTENWAKADPFHDPCDKVWCRSEQAGTLISLAGAEKDAVLEA